MGQGTLFGKGLYSVPEAARLLCVPPRKLRRWALGCHFQISGELRASAPAIQRELDGEHEASDLTFADLIELKFVGMFRGAGVSMSTIRAAAKNATAEFGSDHPFASRKFDTDGRRIFTTLDLRTANGTTAARITEEVAKSQMVFDQMVRPFFLKLEFEADMVAIYRPLGPGSRVVLDPQRSFGKPIDQPSGIQTYVLYQMVHGGSTPEQVAQWYDVDLDAVSASVTYEQSLLSAAA